jgi:hypothetical protein
MFSVLFLSPFTFSSPERQAGRGFQRALSVTPTR